MAFGYICCTYSFVLKSLSIFLLTIASMFIFKFICISILQCETLLWMLSWRWWRRLQRSWMRRYCDYQRSSSAASSISWHIFKLRGLDSSAQTGRCNSRSCYGFWLPTIHFMFRSGTGVRRSTCARDDAGIYGLRFSIKSTSR